MKKRIMSNYDRLLNQMRGFSDGAGSHAINPQYADSKEYEKGFIQGRHQRRLYADAVAATLNVELNKVHAMESEDNFARPTQAGEKRK